MHNKRLVFVVVVALVVTFGVVNFYLANELPSAGPTVSISAAGGADAATAPNTATPPTPTRVNLTPLPPTVSGVVTDGTKPMAGATVQIQGNPTKIQADAKGAFTLTGISGTTPIIVTAWAEGHYVGWA